MNNTVLIILSGIAKRILPLFIVIFFCAELPAQTERKYRELSVVVMVNSEREANSYNEVLTRYEKQNPHIKVSLTYYSDNIYKSNIESWLKNAEYDLLYWQTGHNRLPPFFQQDLLADLTQLWQQEELSENFASNLKPLVTFDNKVVAIPFSYYPWGIFYNKRLFWRLKLSVPRTWDDLLSACKTMDKEGIIPIGLGLKEPWPVLAWFTFLSARIHGLEFYNKLLQGTISWHDQRVITVMQHWQELLDNCPTTNDFQSYDWRLPSQSLLRDQVGIVLSGSYVMQLYDEKMSKRIGFFSFPEITGSLPQAEIAPAEVWVVPAKSENIDIAKDFIRLFISLPSLTNFNTNIDYLSPHKGSPVPAHPVMQEGLSLLQNASGLMPYFDRDAPPEMVKLAQDVFAQFLKDRNIEAALHSLESQRLLLHGPIPAQSGPE